MADMACLNPEVKHIQQYGGERTSLRSLCDKSWNLILIFSLKRLVATWPSPFFYFLVKRMSSRLSALFSAYHMGYISLVCCCLFSCAVCIIWVKKFLGEIIWFGWQNQYKQNASIVTFLNKERQIYIVMFIQSNLLF